MKTLRAVFKLFFISFLLVLITVRSTDADLLDQEQLRGHFYQATTLDFSGRNTANGTPVDLFFDTSGFLPGGFQVEAIRVKKEGQLGFHYLVESNIRAGNPELCQLLELRVLRNWQTVYTGRLPEFRWESFVGNNGTDDLVFVLELPEAPSHLVHQSCSFDFHFRSSKNEYGHALKLSDEETLRNHITTGSW